VPKFAPMKTSKFDLLALLSKVSTTLFKMVKSIKILLAVGTFATYSFLFTWKFALLFILGIGIHEAGHVYAMRKIGIKTKGFYFIPFIGGAAIAEESFGNADKETYVALYGPLFGIFTVIIPLILYKITGLAIYGTAASWLATVNLFNLFPVNPLDGGRVIKCFSFSMHKKVGFAFMILAFIAAIIVSMKLKLGLLIFISILGLMEIPIISNIIIALLYFIITIPFYIIYILFNFYKKKCLYVIKDYKFNILRILTRKHIVDDEYFSLSKNNIFKYTLWYVGMIIFFLSIIMITKSPGAEFSKQFLMS